jgi:delta 1-pyrroline-5-carboxylate dehydrogenase
MNPQTVSATAEKAARVEASDSKPRTYLNRIGGEWVPSRSGRTFENRSPARPADLIGTFPESGPEDVDAAVQAASRAFRAWRLTPAPRRAEIIYRAAEILRDRKEALARAMTREMGKVLAETRWVSAGSLRPGTSRWRFPRGRSFPRSSRGTPW